MKVSFIGLGIMGLPMARHIHQAGWLYKVYNRTAEKMQEFREQGVSITHSPAEAAVGADVIITMVSDSPDVEEVILGSEGVIHHAREGAVVIDMSSINPEVSKSIGQRLAQKNVHFLDAPVSGGEQGAIHGKLAIMVGGERDIVRKVMPVLELMGKSTVHVGALGAGGYAKLANQIIVGIELQALAEAYTLAGKAGLDPDLLYQAIRGGLAGSNLMDNKIKHIVEESYVPGFKVRLHLKDLRNALGAAQSQSLSLPFTQQVKRLLEDMVDAGQGEQDHSALYDYFKKQHRGGYST